MSEGRTAIWNLLHDGIVQQVQRHDKALHLGICIPYLAERASPGSDHLKLILHDCTDFTFKPYGDDSLITDRTSISELELLILSTDSQSAESVQICTDRGILQVGFAELSIQLEDGSPISFQKLDEIASGYWDDFPNRP